MNWLLILVILFLIWNIGWGYAKGFLRVLYSMVGWILIVAFMFLVTPFVTDILMEHSTIYDKLKVECYEELREATRDRIANAASHEGIIGEGGNDLGENKENKADLLGVLGILFPDEVNGVLQETGKMTDQVLEATGIYDKLAGEMARFAVSGIAYGISLVLGIIIYIILGISIRVLEKVPVIGTINQIVGLAGGAVKGIFLIWIFFAILSLSSATETGRFLVTYIYESPLLTYIYDNNIIKDFIMMGLTR